MLVLPIVSNRINFHIVIFLCVVLFSGCSESEDSEFHVLKALNEGIVNSNATVNRSTETLMASLNEKLKDPATSIQTEKWYPRAKHIHQLSVDACNYVETLKNDLKKEAGIKSVDGTEIYKEKDKDVVKRMFIANEKAEELYTTLKKYKQDVLAVDRKIDEAFNDNIHLASESSDLPGNNSEDFAHFFFSKTSLIAAIAMLNHIQNQIRHIENRTIQFCHEHCTAQGFICTFEWPIIAQDKTYVREGEKIEITAGIGEFRWRFTKPEIKINGKIIELDGTGVATNKISVSAKPGKHYVPVKITYTDQDGKMQTVEKNVEYIVEEPCN
jgi:gliding motility-associated protein GldM